MPSMPGASMPAARTRARSWSAIEAPVIRRTGSWSPAMVVYASAARSTLPRRRRACAMLSRFITLLGSLRIACSLMASASSGRLMYRQSSAKSDADPG